MPTKHTPGPWRAVGAWVEHEKDDVADVCNCDPESMGQKHFGRSMGEMMANARLCAAAPELLRACKAMLRYSETDPYFEKAVALSRSAIANAEGK